MMIRSYTLAVLTGAAVLVAPLSQAADDVAPAVSEAVAQEAYLGVSVRELHPAMLAQLQLDHGLVVDHIAPRSPAADALALHDVLVELDGQLLIHPRQLQVLVKRAGVGAPISLTVLRAGERQTISVEAGARPPSMAGFDQHMPPPPMPGGTRPFFGPPGGPSGPGALAPSRGPGADPLEHMPPEVRALIEQHGGLDAAVLTMPSVGSASTRAGGAFLGGRQDSVISDGEFTVRRSRGPKGDSLFVEDSSGTVLYDGPSDQQAAIDLLPEQARSLVAGLLTPSAGDR
jgi:hypothetical protein